MKVRISGYIGHHRPGNELELEDYLHPRADPDYRGAIEEARAQAEENAIAIGRLLAKLVERRVLSLGDAEEVAGIYTSAEIIGETQ